MVIYTMWYYVATKKLSKTVKMGKCLVNIKNIQTGITNPFLFLIVHMHKNMKMFAVLPLSVKMEDPKSSWCFLYFPSFFLTINMHYLCN